MIRTIADQYLAQNAGRRYPLADDTPYDDVHTDTAILDFRCTVRKVPAGVLPVAWLTKVDTKTDGGKTFKVLTVTVSRPGVPDTLEFMIPRDMASMSPYTAYASDPTTGATGAITVSASVLSLDDGMASSPFARSTVVCDSLKVDRVASGHLPGDARDEEADPASRNAAEPISGEITLAEGRNAEPYLDGNRLRLDIYKGAGLGENCQAVVSGQTCDNVMFTINGERPGSDGNIRITGADGVTVSTDADAHSITVKLDDVARGMVADECRSACNGG